MEVELSWASMRVMGSLWRRQRPRVLASLPHRLPFSRGSLQHGVTA
jgi:hypothetical protein